MAISLLIVIGGLMVSGIWTMWIYRMQALIGGLVVSI